jgi:hypothetical protein
MIEIVLGALGVYALIGVLVAIPFALLGAKKVDPGAEKGSWGFKILIIPGAAAFWPLMLGRWVRCARPTECSAHRRAAARSAERNP